jgi:hypothetical protein
MFDPHAEAQSICALIDFWVEEEHFDFLFAGAFLPDCLDGNADSIKCRNWCSLGPNLQRKFIGQEFRLYFPPCQILHVYESLQAKSQSQLRLRKGE